MIIVISRAKLQHRAPRDYNQKHLYIHSLQMLAARRSVDGCVSRNSHLKKMPVSNFGQNEMMAISGVKLIHRASGGQHP